ncbi:MAG: DUF4920 domain-containing protein [Fulvivirga sp.]|uniref:DUF4920 domain-containing protein n=1 Tax=Fulvivirga sp. TaxID=1931237 RepID=UPI0032EBEA0C
MKKLVSILFVLIVYVPALNAQHFGEEFSKQEVIKITELPAIMAKQDSAILKVNSEITATCKMKGCWMTVKGPDEQDIRITFKNYGFFVPKDGMEGKSVTFEGILKKVTTDVATLRHFAEDAGKTEEEIQSITDPKEEYSFVASGVFIED